MIIMIISFTKRLLTNQTNQIKPLSKSISQPAPSSPSSYQPPESWHCRLLVFPVCVIIIGEDSFVITSRQHRIHWCEKSEKLLKGWKRVTERGRRGQTLRRNVLFGWCRSWLHCHTYVQSRTRCEGFGLPWRAIIEESMAVVKNRKRHQFTCQKSAPRCERACRSC
jgi:hypothetical protein